VDFRIVKFKFGAMNSGFMGQCFKGSAIDALKSFQQKKSSFGSIGVIKSLGILQYANDTVLFLDVIDESIATMKFLLYCYEAMSGRGKAGRI
jgi:hypothetical protein